VPPLFDPRNPAVVITFDDGLASDHAISFPLLREAKAVAHFFINTANVGAPGHMNWAQIAKLHCAGMHIGSHGHEHADLSRLQNATLVHQLVHSRKILEGHLQDRISWFAAPYGLVSRSLFSAVTQSGYQGICTSHCWPAKPHSIRVPRIALYEDTTIEEFRSLLLGKPSPYLVRNLRAAGKYIPKQLLLRLRPSMLGVNVPQEEQ